jgi:hypothetical protein
MHGNALIAVVYFGAILCVLIVAAIRSNARMKSLPTSCSRCERSSDEHCVHDILGTNEYGRR